MFLQPHCSYKQSYEKWGHRLLRIKLSGLAPHDKDPRVRSGVVEVVVVVGWWWWWLWWQAVQSTRNLFICSNIKYHFCYSKPRLKTVTACPGPKQWLSARCDNMQNQQRKKHFITIITISRQKHYNHDNLYNNLTTIIISRQKRDWSDIVGLIQRHCRNELNGPISCNSPSAFLSPPPPSSCIASNHQQQYQPFHNSNIILIFSGFAVYVERCSP